MSISDPPVLRFILEENVLEFNRETMTIHVGTEVRLETKLG